MPRTSKPCRDAQTDIKDAEWLADLLQHGLLRASFVPPRPQRELRDLTRYRSSLVADRARLVNRIHKILEDTNLKLTSVVTDITGKSGRAILDALLSGQNDPEILAELARGRMRSKRDELALAVQGTLSEHHRFAVRRASCVKWTFWTPRSPSWITRLPSGWACPLVQMSQTPWQVRLLRKNQQPQHQQQSVMSHPPRRHPTL
jgi:hypothetical protein